MGSPSVPEPQPAPSSADAINAWIAGMPQVYETQMEYAPLEAQQQLDLAQQFAGPMGQAYQEAQAAMNPETAALQEQLAAQAGEGMQADMPQWMQDKYRDEMASQLGTNVGSGIGADYQSRGMLSAQKEYQDYYRNLGLSVAGRQPLAQPQSPEYSNYMGNYSPTASMGFQAQNYGTQMQGYGMQQQANSANYASQMKMMGAGMTGAAAMIP